jgi:hypothetical protein
MKSPNGAVAQFRFSTDDIAERERLTAWREVLRRAITVLDIAPVGRRAFGADATVCQLPGLSVLSVASSAVHLAHQQIGRRRCPSWRHRPADGPRRSSGVSLSSRPATACC